MMGEMKKHPIYRKADMLLHAFVLSGFALLDNGEKKEVEQASVSMELFRDPDAAEQILLADGSYALRARLLPAQLTGIPRTLPVRAVTFGRIYDGRDDQYPQRHRIEGVIADRGLPFRDLETLWKRVGLEAFGIESETVLAAAGKDLYRIVVRKPSPEGGERELTLGTIGAGTWIARALLGQEAPDVSVWVFSIDVDALAMEDYGIASRKDLYSPLAPYLEQSDCSCPSYGTDFSSRARNVLRRRGYLEFIGERVYTADAYVRMNMIQEAWDTNNAGLTLVKPLPNYHNPLTPLETRDGLPTVLAPSLEQAMSENFAAGVPSVRLFEIGHIFKPGRGGGEPWEKLSLSIGAYRKDLTLNEFLGEVSAVLRELGVSNHFFIPTDMAIAYDQRQCRVILDEKMKYLDGNCGHISPVALKNFRIDTEAFMAQFELDTIEQKSAEEYAFVPYELR
ncbi:MAG: hypothetical protein IJH75_03670 [Mogibacterium sp.]|nr:hypothetical protein [Mogibacterium sp.]